MNSGVGERIAESRREQQDTKVLCYAGMRYKKVVDSAEMVFGENDEKGSSTSVGTT
jgi:hypothetical protein